MGTVVPIRRRFSVQGEGSRHKRAWPRRIILAMCTTDGIGDDALHLMEEALDWLEMTVAALPLSWMEAIGSQFPRTRLTFTPRLGPA